MLERLDVEAERGRDGVDVLPVELLQDRRLAGVVQASVGDEICIRGRDRPKPISAEMFCRIPNQIFCQNRIVAHFHAILYSAILQFTK